jgi:hypothetical protein
MHTIPTHTPITRDLSPDQIADLIDQAAQLIERDGLEIGGYWPDSLLRPYEPGDSCCTAGALAAVAGYHEVVTVEDTFVGIGHYDTETGETEPDHPHPVFAAAMSALGFRRVEDLYDWSDNAGGREVVAELRDAAAKIRARGAVA